MIEEPLRLCGGSSQSSGGTNFPKTVELSRQMAILSGRYPLPPPVDATPDDSWPPQSERDVQDATEVPLSIVLRDREGPLQFTMAEPIRAETVVGTYSMVEFNDERLNVRLRGTLRLSNGELWDLIVLFDHQLYDSDTRTVRVSGGDLEQAQGRYVSLRCPAEGSTSSRPCNGDRYPFPSGTSLRFYECDFPWAPTFEWEIRYPAGSATFSTQVTTPRNPEINTWFPAILVEARGEHAGVEWTQENPLYMTTVSNALWYDSIMPAFAVRFPEPIDGACGLSTDVGERMVDGGYRGYPEVQTFDCDYQRLDAWEAESVERVEEED